MRFVLTGTGRSGTGYTAALLTAAGLPCGHERYFRASPAVGEVAVPRDDRLGALRRPIGRVRESARRRRIPDMGDASWMAVPRLHRFSGLRILQVRHPMKVVRSFVVTDLFSPQSPYRAQRNYALRFFAPTLDPVLDAMRWWVHWNEWAMRHTEICFPLERLDRRVLARLIECIGIDQPEARAELALSATRRSVNSTVERGGRTPALRWSDLPRGPALDRLESLAVDLGYDPADEDHLPNRTLGLD